MRIISCLGRENIGYFVCPPLKGLIEWLPTETAVAASCERKRDEMRERYIRKSEIDIYR